MEAFIQAIVWAEQKWSPRRVSHLCGICPISALASALLIPPRAPAHRRPAPRTDLSSVPPAHNAPLRYGGGAGRVRQAFGVDAVAGLYVRRDAPWNVRRPDVSAALLYHFFRTR